MKIDRINNIHELLKQVHSISINDLCKTFDVSKNTIRRDIAELEKDGIIRKVYGGIVLAVLFPRKPQHTGEKTHSAHRGIACQRR